MRHRCKVHALEVLHVPCAAAVGKVGTCKNGTHTGWSVHWHQVWEINVVLTVAGHATRSCVVTNSVACSRVAVGAHGVDLKARTTGIALSSVVALKCPTHEECALAAVGADVGVGGSSASSGARRKSRRGRGRWRPRRKGWRIRRRRTARGAEGQRAECRKRTLRTVCVVGGEVANRDGVPCGIGRENRSGSAIVAHVVIGVLARVVANIGALRRVGAWSAVGILGAVVAIRRKDGAGPTCDTSKR